MSRYGMGLIAVTALVVAAAAAHSGLSNIMTVNSVKSVLEFSDEERGRIFDGIMRVSDAPVTEMAASPEVADFLPEEVPTQELPIDIIREIPLVRGHKFVKFDDRILVISATSRLVVAMIPRYKLLQ